MNSEVPKQYMALHGESMLTRSIRTLIDCPAIDGVVVVLAPDDQEFDELPANITESVVTTLGGATRSASVESGVHRVADLAGPQSWALVHDAARPLLSSRDLLNLISQVTGSGAVGGLLASPVPDTIKRSDASDARIMETVDRNRLWQAQTPQLFRAELLLNALDAASNDGVTVTDEASAVEHLGESPLLIQAMDPNFKITRNADLLLASAWLSTAQPT